MLHYYILVNKKPVETDVLTWATFLEDDDKRRVALYKENGICVSTVFMGMPMFSIDKNKLLLFETMVFGGECDGEQRRYETWDEAVKGHDLLVAACSIIVPTKYPLEVSMN